jgi:hypothetical protein
LKYGYEIKRALTWKISEKNPIFQASICKNPNFKHQVTNKSQIPIINDQTMFGISNLGYCYLFDICDLGFGISDNPSPLIYQLQVVYNLVRFNWRQTDPD